MEEIKEVLVGEVNTSPSNEEKKLILKKGLINSFKENIEDQNNILNDFIFQIAEYKEDYLKYYKIELSNDKENNNYITYTFNRRVRLNTFKSRINLFFDRSSYYKKEYNYYKINGFKHQKEFIRKSMSLFDNMAEILDSTYGQDKWDTYDNSIVIHFTDFYITNGHSKNYIKDLYVLLSFEIKSKNESKVSLNGIRATVSPMEYIRNYGHSHLSGGCFYKGTFCLGSGPLNQTICTIIPDYNDDLFQLFLYQLNDYVKWESIQGGPYRRINSIYANKKINYAKWLSLEYAYRKFIENKCKFEIILNNNSIDVKLDESSLNNIIQYYSRDYRCVKFEGQYYNYKFIDGAPSSFQPNNLLTFQNKEIKSKIELSTNAEYSYETTTNPRVIWYIKERLISSIEQKIKATRSTDGTKSTSNI